MSLTESIVEDAALTWFGELGYAVGHGPQMGYSCLGAEALTRALFLGERESCAELPKVVHLSDMRLQKLRSEELSVFVIESKLEAVS